MYSTLLFAVGGIGGNEEGILIALWLLVNSPSVKSCSGFSDAEYSHLASSPGGFLHLLH